MKFIKSIASALLCAIVTSGYSFPSGTYTNTFVRNGTTYVQRGQLKPSDYVVTNVNTTAESIDALPLAGGTLTGDLAVGEEHTASLKLTVSSESDANGITLQGGKSNGNGSRVFVGGSTGSGGSIIIEGGGTIGGRLYVGDITGAGGGAIEVSGKDASIKKDGKEVATEEYVDATISATNTTFSNAVLAVGLNIDTNSVAVLNEIASTFGGFPIEGTATTVGGLLAALAAAVAWLKKNKADKKDADSALGFSTYPIKSVVGNALLDRTVNTSTGGAFTFPEGGDGARDFVVVVAESATAPSVSFPSSGVSYFSDDDAVWTAEADKVNVWYFTEIAANQFMVAHKALEACTQA